MRTQLDMMQAVAVDFWQYTAIHGLHVRGHPPCFTSRRRQLAKCYSCSTVFVTLLRCLLAAFIVVKNVFYVFFLKIFYNIV